MPACTKEYLQALTDPFGLSKPACIPDMHVVPSKKNTLITHGTLSTDTTGFGFLVVNPFCAANNLFTCTDTGVQYLFGLASYSDGTATLTSVQTFQNNTSPNGVVATPVPQSPYGIADFHDHPSAVPNGGIDAQVRIVGAGVQIRYTGTRLNEGGTLYATRRSDGESMNAMSIPEVASRRDTITCPVNNTWKTVSYIPIQPDDYDYCTNGLTGTRGQANITTNITTAVEETRYNMGFLIKSAAASQPFEFRIIQHVEFVGKALDSVTRSHSDIVGMSAVRNVTAQTLPAIAGKSIYNAAVKQIEMGATYLAQNAGQMLVKYAMG